MDLKALKTFHRIVSLGGFNRAAEELNYAQSTVTMQIKKLEAELGILLIERGKLFQLTEAGRVFHQQSTHIVKDIEHLEATMSDMLVGEAGNIRVGAVEPIASCQLPGILDRFLSKYPKIRISVDIANTAALSERLLKGELDLALCSRQDIGTALYFEPLFSEDLVFLVPERHPLASNPTLSFEDIKHHRMLLTSKNCLYRKKIEIALQERCENQVETMEISSMAAMKHYVEGGLGIALVPKSIASPQLSGTVARKINGTRISITFGMLCKAADYPLKLACAKLYQYLKQELAGPGDTLDDDSSRS
ncbi:LysR family transcriptional regulator [Paenibacillus sp. OSY-SE]|uniref:LysR family transcriptional regulator n=1 Tax=Paenibacillus sp. OSY-SE TaxID=1196323 RepID=UPI0002DF7FDD|nr:LysR family transcriptional regulator [Paenibacillus sp. OSY-SE]